MLKIIFLIFSAVILGGCNVKNFFVKPPAGLEITSTTPATVYLEGADKGATPFSNQTLKPGSYLLKLVPTDSSLAPYETKLDLSSGTSTVISRSFATSEVDSSGYTLKLIESTPDDTHLSIISDPDMVNVNLDGSPKGFTPLSKLSVNPGTHTLAISSPGFVSQELGITAVKGYNLVVDLKLASATLTLAPSPTPSPVASSSASPTASPSSSPRASSPASSTLPTSNISKPYVVIGETETGWLRVRQDASGTSAELGKANTGEKLKYLGLTTDLGWHEVEFEGQTGYVSAKYCTLVQ